MANVSYNPIGWQLDVLYLSDEQSSAYLPPITRADWSIENLPDGLSFNSTTHSISGRPTTAGTFVATVHLTTNWGTTSQNITFTIY